MTVRLPRTAVTLAVAAVLLSACAAPAAAPAAAPSAEATLHGSSGGQAFFDELRPGQAVTLKGQPRTLREAYAETTAVVEAHVTGVRPGRTLGEPGMSSILVDLRPSRVLRGALRPELPSVTVEFGVLWDPTVIDGKVRRMRADLPDQPGVWLLRWQGEVPEDRKPGVPPSRTEDPALYRTIHPNCGVFVQRGARVEAPGSQDVGRPRDAQAEAERFPTLAALADHAVSS